MNTIKQFPAKQARKEITTGQASFDLKVAKERTIRGIGMGVLSDGTAFLQQRGLARLCGVQNAHIGTISSQWNEDRPRINKIRELMAERGVTVSAPHIEVKHGQQTIYAYPDSVCLAVLEYYAFDAGSNVQTDAIQNFRTLAGRALQDFIYAQVGYDPNNDLPEVWRAFHDRVSLSYDSVPRGYFSVFKEIADMIVTLGQAGLHISASFLPDISVGQAWSKYWVDNDLSSAYGGRKKFEQNYPDYFPQAKSNPQEPWCYPEAALGDFREWFRETYIGQGAFKTYLEGKVKRRELTASFVQLAITAYSDED